jgi:hypothetical protein
MSNSIPERPIAIREALLNRVYPIIERLKGNMSIIGYDIQLQSFTQAGPTGNPVLINTYCLVINTLGAILGEENHLSYTFTFDQSPKAPNDIQLEQYVKETLQRLGIMRVRQLQMNRPQNDGN